MKYNPNLHNFNKFISEWDVEKEYVLFGASKECVQFIRSMDFLFGSEKLKIKCIVDHEVKTGIASNLNEVSEYYHQSKDFLNTRTDIRLVNLNDFDKYIKDFFNNKVIITSDEYRQYYKDYLDKQNIKYTWYKNIASIWPFLLKQKVHIFQTDVLVTEKCNLACSFCNMFIPHYELPKHRDIQIILSDIDSYFNLVDYVSIFHLVGGEPFLHPNIKDIIEYILEKYSDKIDKFIITTNGTVLPREEILEVLKNNNVILSVSNYSNKLEKLKSKVDRVLETYKVNNINHYVRNNIEWYDFGDLRIKNNMSEEELINHFDLCTAPFRGLNDGKFYYCHLNTSAVLTKLFPLNDNDYVNLSDVSSEDLIKFDLGFTEIGYITFCDNCNGCNTGIKIPVSYKEQGLRK
jgi:organic radical activating enzyme